MLCRLRQNFWLLLIVKKLSFLILGCPDDLKENTPTDIVFMLDASASLYEYGFRNEKTFVNDVIEKVGPLRPNGLRVGVVVYGEKASMRIKLDDFFDTLEFKTAVDNLIYDESSSTRIDLGLKKSKEAFTEENGARGSSKKVRRHLTSDFTISILAPSVEATVSLS